MTLREKRNELLKESLKLRKIYFNEVGADEISKDRFFRRMTEIRKKQDLIYKRWRFYDKYIKAMEEIE